MEIWDRFSVCAAIGRWNRFASTSSERFAQSSRNRWEFIQDAFSQEISDHGIHVWFTSHKAVRWKHSSPILDEVDDFFLGMFVVQVSFRESNIQLC
jgi:hypothetical protein